MNRRDFCLASATALLAGCRDAFEPTSLPMSRAVTVRPLYDQVFTTRVNLGNCAGLDVRGCTFLQGFTGTGGPWFDFADNIVIGGQVQAHGPMRRVAFFHTALSNPHFLVPWGSRGDTFEDLTFEALSTSATGDCFLLPNLDNLPVRHYSLVRPLVIPNGAGNNSGTVVSQLGGIGCAVSVLNPTAIMGTGGGLGFGETFLGYPGIYRQLSGGLFWDTTPRGYYLRDMSSGACLSDNLPQSGLGSNLVWQAKVSPKTGRYGISAPLSYTPPDPVQVDPMFRDATVSLRAFAASKGMNRSNADAMTLLRGGTPPQELLAYLRDGFTPTNPAALGYGAV